MQQMLRRVLG